MKPFLLLLLLSAVVGAVVAAPDEVSLRKALSERSADFAYRFSSWSSAENAETFSVTLLFFFRKDGESYDAHQSGMPIPSRAEIEVVASRKGKLRTSKETLNQKEADEMLCRFGYSGFFAQDSDDSIREIFDGHGLNGERLFKGVYTARSRKVEEHLSCEWLYHYWEGYTMRANGGSRK